MALLDELVKIADDSKPKPKIAPALRAMLLGAAGGATGYALSDALANRMSFFKALPENLPTEQATNILARRTAAAKVILPILSGTAVMLADRYRQKMNDEYKKVPGYDKK